MPPSIYNHKKTKSGQNQCHSTGVKKSYFGHTFHLRPIKVFWWKVTLVSVCVHFWTFRHTDSKWTSYRHTDTWTYGNKMDTEHDNLIKSKVYVYILKTDVTSPVLHWSSLTHWWQRFLWNNISRHFPLGQSESLLHS